MGLDWVVLDREIDGIQVNPTEILGAIDWLRFWSDKGFEIVADY
ncbi:MAG TPA: hypothetical protein VN851_06490 [Thermoanaerobaculia bacterium]|nr:hypothetical protein [Thermoanaerobaculia bacterium]